MSNQVLLKQDGEPFISYKHQIHYNEMPESYLSHNYVILRVTNGSADWKIGNRVYRVEKNDFVIMSEIVPRRIERVYGILEYDVMGIYSTLLSKHTFVLPLFYCRSESFSHLIRFSEDENAMACMLFYRIVSEMNADEPLKLYMIENLLVSLATLCFREELRICPDFISKGGKYTRLFSCIAEVTTYIENNVDDDLSCEALSKRFGLSASYLAKVFREITGTSIGHYVNEARVSNVIRLIKKEKMPVLDAAYASGFNTSSGFYKTFNSITGMSPMQFVGKGE